MLTSSCHLGICHLLTCLPDHTLHFVSMTILLGLSPKSLCPDPCSLPPLLTWVLPGHQHRTRDKYSLKEGEAQNSRT